MKSMIVDTRNNTSYKDMVEDQKAAQVLGEAAVQGAIWYTDQELGKHILDKLNAAGFILVSVL